MNPVGDGLSDVASSDDGEDGKDEVDDGEDPDLGKLSEDVKPCWDMGTTTNTVQHHMERFRQKLRTCDELTQPGWGDAANNMQKRDMKYGTSEFRVLAVIKPHTNTFVDTPAPKTLGELMESHDTIHGKLQQTFRQGSCHMRLASGTPPSQERRASLPPDIAPNQ